MQYPETSGEILSIDKAETVRAILKKPSGEVLLLQKGKDSKIPDMYEFPGGKIEVIQGEKATLEEQQATVLQEVLEETGINVESGTLHKVDQFTHTFVNGQTRYDREIAVFVVSVPGDVAVVVNRTLKESGEPEDKHQGFLWVSQDELQAMADDGKLSPSSTRFQDALTVAQ